MGLFAAILGGIGGLCAIMGIVTAAEVLEDPVINRNFTWEFWLILAAVLLLGSIAAAMGRGEGGGYD